MLTAFCPDGSVAEGLCEFPVTNAAAPLVQRYDAGMPFSSRVLSAVCAIATVAVSVPAPLHADAYDGSPKLAIILVFDQFRGDFLDRYRVDFHAKNGWNLFLRRGAHFTDCYYDYANLVTAAGHSTIGTASYTDGHNVPQNQWTEVGPDGKLREVSSVEDDRYLLVGAPEGTPRSPGASPKNERASTVGDELVLATSGRARVYGVSFKDRAAILTSGHATRGAFWTDHTTGAWETSTYWMPELPAWAKAFNSSTRAAQARTEAHVPSTAEFYGSVGRTPASVSYQLDFAKALIEGEKLGRNPAGVTDMLTLSISSTDILGHAVGPDSPEDKAMIVAADGQLDSFFTWLDSYVGLNHVVIAFTADHGVAPTPAAANAMGMPSASFSLSGLKNSVETSLDKQFKLKNNTYSVIGMDLPWLQIDPAVFAAEGVNEADAENATAEAVRSYFHQIAVKAAEHAPSETRLPQTDALQFVYTATDLRTGHVPDTAQGRREMHSYSTLERWAVHINLAAYDTPGYGMGTTHYSANAYDRHVPLDFFGPQFVPGTYHGTVAPVDIAATFASLLRINQPSASIGNVLTQAMRPDRAYARPDESPASHMHTAEKKAQ